MRPRRIAIALLSLFVVGLLSSPSAARPAPVEIVDLGTLGGDATFALDINDRGQVTGNSRTGEGPLSPFLWERGEMTDLGALPGGNGFSRGYAVSNRGTVVGESDNDFSRGFRWSGGELGDVGTLTGGTTAVAHDVNAIDRIVGAASNGSASRPFVAERGADPVDLGTLAGDSTSFGLAWAVNARGDVVGISRNAADSASQATLWPAGVPGSAVNLGSLDGVQFSQAFAVNYRRIVVGESTVASGDGRAVAWYGTAAPVELDGLGYRHSRANDVNDRGSIVGHVSSFRGFSTIDGRAVVWYRGTATDLNDLLPDGSGWVLHSAEGINRGGEIVGFGRLDGQLRSFLLKVPESALR